MSTQARALARYAHSLMGTPFRVGGQTPEHGFDCIGFVRHCLIETGCPVADLPSYRGRNLSIAPFCALAKSVSLRPVGPPLHAGDILVTKPSAAQFHLAIMAQDGSAIHAHAGLRHVAASPMPLPWPLIAIWRFNETGEPLWQHSS